MFKTLIKSWSSSTEKWGQMAVATGTFQHSHQPPGRVKLYPGMVDILYEATSNGSMTILKAWINIREQNIKGYSGYAPKPLGLPDPSVSSDDRVVNLQNVASYRRMRFYIELLKATRILDETRRPSIQGPTALGDWLSPETTVLLEWADWDLLSRYSIPVRNIPIEIDLLSEVKSRDNDLSYFPFSKGDIFGLRVLVDQSQDNYWFSSGDAISVVGCIVDEELE